MNCSVLDCARVLFCKGFCKMHYERARRGADLNAPVKKDMTLDELFDARQVTVTEAGCCEWQSGRDADGYGLFTAKGTTQRAHRFSYQRYIGPIPEGLMVLHRCDNPPCINPIHLFLGTAQDNTDDMVSKGRKAIRCGPGHHYAKLNDEAVAAIRQSEEPTSVLARQLGVSISTVASARSGKTWKHVKVPPQTEEKLAELQGRGRCRGVNHPKVKQQNALLGIDTQDEAS